MERVIGVYLKTLQRDELTGETTFIFCPDEYYKNAQNGIIKCIGRIELYQKNAPIFIEGQYEEEVFKVKNSGYPNDSKKSCIQLLEYISNDFTEKEKETIAEICNYDLLRFVELPKSELEFKKILKRKANSNKLIRLIYSKTKEIKRENELYHFLLQYNVPYDRIYSLQKNAITMDELKKNPYFDCLFNGIDIYTADVIANKLNDVKEYDVSRLIGYI